MKKRNLLLIISTIAIVIFLITFYLNILEINEQSVIVRTGMRPKLNPFPIEYRMWLSPISLIIAIVPISYYLISKKLESNMKTILNLINKNNNKTKNPKEINNKNTVLKLLSLNERKVLEKLIERDGKALQSEINRMEGMNKLKTHRAIKNLELRNIIKTEKYGKTKSVILLKDIKNIMLK